MSKHIIILAVPGVQLLDVSGPLDVFAQANQQRGREVYKLSVMGTGDQGVIPTSSGARIVADLSLQSPQPDAIDTFLVAGAPQLDEHLADESLREGICRWSQHAKRFGSVCSGALLLASAGLLNDRRVTTHWSVADKLSADYPRVKVEADAIFIADGALRTAAGVTSGLDLALNMVEEDLGQETALDVAAQLVMFFKRPGGQMQFSRHGQASLSGRSALQDVQRWVINSLNHPHNVQSLALHMGISPRHLTRLFNQELSQSPAQWLEQQRVFHARHLLESGELAIKQIAAECGFSGVDILRRAFVRQFSVTPSQYQKHHIR